MILTTFTIADEGASLGIYDKSNVLFNFSSSIRFVDSFNPLKTRLQPPSTRRTKRQDGKSIRSQSKNSRNIGDKDLFLSGPTTDGRTVLTAIDGFDQIATVQEKTSANFAVLKGHHVSECSDSYGTFSSALVKTQDVERQRTKAEIRTANQMYHDLYNNAAESSSALLRCSGTVLLISAVFVNVILSQK